MLSAIDSRLGSGGLWCSSGPIVLGRACRNMRKILSGGFACVAGPMRSILGHGLGDGGVATLVMSVWQGFWAAAGPGYIDLLVRLWHGRQVLACVGQNLGAQKKTARKTARSAPFGLVLVMGVLVGANCCSCVALAGFLRSSESDKHMPQHILPRRWP